MRVALGSMLAFILGAIVVYIAVVASAFLYMETNHVFDRDGGMSMAVMFAIGPLAGFAGGVIAALATGVWLFRRQKRTADAGPPSKPWPLPVLIALAVLAGVGIYGVG